MGHILSGKADLFSFQHNYVVYTSVTVGFHLYTDTGVIIWNVGRKTRSDNSIMLGLRQIFHYVIRSSDFKTQT